MNRVAANLRACRSSSSEEITMEPDGLQTFIDDVGRMVSSTDDEQPGPVPGRFTVLCSNH
jgi:hypothetical protein